MQFWRYGRTECDECQKGENSIALEQSKRKNEHGENKCTDESFCCFKSQVLAGRADSSDFHVSRTRDI